MGATSPERHREVAVTPFQSDLTGATQRGRSRLHHPERRDLERHNEVARVSITRSDATWSDTASSLASPSPGATQRGRSRRATQSDVSQRPLQVAPEAWSDLPERLLEVAASLLFARIHFYSRTFWSFHYARFYFSKPMF
ncbi:hypothetical protein DY000_02052788 [Brassica cretica]|uniref:Uncharacterized protein n=1 Tax=Brassica cretica TaxID=69181 RepID=A0ABQ7AIX4_BRACR|nr:hypothetical protein DY000_02052788 [Brassica cretica]